jgi:hypothetical protein
MLGGVMAAGAARADNVVARWIQIAPGSSSATPTTANFGDAPLSLTNTVLARAIVDDISQGCPSLSLDHGTPMAMTQRFDPTTLADTALYPAVGKVPGTPGKTNGKTGYPQYFINAAATSGESFLGINGGPMATSAWTECEAIVPPGHTVATIGTVDLKLPIAHPKTILVMADTGCRINGALASNGANQQDCQNSAAFPLQFLQAYEALYKPDLIVQVGDWFYRDTNCLSNGTETFVGCNTPATTAYETWGDTFDSWNADLFFPAKTLLATAPWVMVRGNHESCGRGARGWYALLDPHPYSFANVACAATSTYPAPGGTAAAPIPTYNGDFEASYLVPIGNVNLLVHDSSFANDSAVDTNMAANYDADLTRALAAAGVNSSNIFVTHKPTFALVQGTVTGNVDNGGDFTEQAVFSGGTYPGSAFVKGVPKSIGLFLSGHVHQLEYLNGPAHFAPALIVGMGGSLLDPDMNTGLVPNGVSDPPGFSQASTTSDAYSMDVHQYNGTVTTDQFAHSYAHDEFGFALLQANDTAGGMTTGYTVNAFKITSTHGGRCLIDLGNSSGSTRHIACNF